METRLEQLKKIVAGASIGIIATELSTAARQIVAQASATEQALTELQKVSGRTQAELIELIRTSPYSIQQIHRNYMLYGKFPE